MRALIVEDSSVVRKVIQLKLRQSGIAVREILEAGDGEQALNLIRQAEADSNPLGLILCDLNMPVLDGLAFIDRLRAEDLCTRTLIVVITTEFKETSVLRALASGVSGYITKPFTGEQLRACIQPLITLSEARDAADERAKPAPRPAAQTTA